METRRRRQRLGLDCSRQHKVTPLPFGDVSEAVDENRPPNFSSSTRRGRGTGGAPRKRKFASPCGLSEQRLSPSSSSPSSVPPLLLACSTAPPKRCKEEYDAYFGTSIEDCSSGRSLRCSNCTKPNLMRNFKLSLESDTDQRPGKSATIQNIASN